MRPTRRSSSSSTLRQCMRARGRSDASSVARRRAVPEREVVSSDGGERMEMWMPAGFSSLYT